MEWNERLRRKMEELGWDMRRLSKESGVNYDSVNKYVHGIVKQPRGNAMELLAKAVGVKEIWLRDGINIDQSPAPKPGRRARGGVDKSPEQKIIHELDTRAGIGGGGMIDEFTGENFQPLATEENFRDEWVIPPSFLSGVLRMDAGRAWIIEVRGDSGYDPANPGAPGSLFPGDRVIVDTTDRRPSPPGPFLIHDGVGLVVKLAEVKPKSDPVMVKLSSRNPVYDPYDVTEDEARIIGRVRGRISAM